MTRPSRINAAVEWLGDIERLDDDINKTITEVLLFICLTLTKPAYPNIVGIWLAFYSVFQIAWDTEYISENGKLSFSLIWKGEALHPDLQIVWSNIVFLYIYVDDQLIFLLQLEMEDGDSIDVFQQQTGGGQHLWSSIPLPPTPTPF